MAKKKMNDRPQGQEPPAISPPELSNPWWERCLAPAPAGGAWIRAHTPELGPLWASLGGAGRDWAEREKILVALAQCLQYQGHWWPFARQILVAEAPVFGRFLEPNPGGLTAEPQSKKRKTVALGDLAILRACLIFVDTDAFFHRLWPWAQLMARLERWLDPECRWYGAEVLGHVFHYDAAQKIKLAHLAPDDYARLTAQYLRTTHPEAGPTSEVPVMPALSLSDQGGRVARIAGVPLLKVPARSTSDEPAESFVAFDLMTDRLRRVALAVTTNQPVLLRGPMGSGKTTIVEHLVAATGRREGRDFFRIQITDQTDGRSLLGGYTCSQVPGHFVWKSGLLAEAVLRGHWLLIEDIDQAQIDVMSTLIPLLEGKGLYLPSQGGKVTPEPGFHLFLTQRDSDMKLSAGRLLTVECPEFQAQDMYDMSVARYPRLATVLPRIIAVVLDINGRLNRNRDRVFTIRDILSWCARCERQCGAEQDLEREVLFLEALHVFCHHLPNLEVQLERSALFAQVLNINSDQLAYYVRERVAPVVFAGDVLKVGRTCLDLAASTMEHASMPFCLTSQSANLLEFLTISVMTNQACLLVGETGVGKTTTVQFLSRAWGKKLHVINLCEQSEASDLFGGFKPVDLSYSLLPVLEQFKRLSAETYTSKKNKKVLGHLTTIFHNKSWSDLVDLCLKIASHSLDDPKVSDKLKLEWEELHGTLSLIRKSIADKVTNLFAFVSGVVSEAIKNGDWVLLDEVNMAEKELLIGVISILTNTQEISLADGESRVRRHPDFRLFACMNPSTDVGKRDLPSALRNRFLEYYLGEPHNRKDLESLVSEYLKNLHVQKKTVNQVLDFYQKIKILAQKRLCDGTGHRPSFSLRTLCRALSIASRNPCGGHIDKSLSEAFCICFLTELDRESYPIVLNCIIKHLTATKAGGKANSQEIIKPAKKGERFVQIEGFWIKCGHGEPVLQEDYILTLSVRQNLKDMSRIISLSEFPVLIQGETSVGKTSLITYLAKASGNQCVRINNHEHTDIQEYVGSYGADSSGAFVFHEGALATAMRQGHWVILDELNLASTEILEALNRVLDDNRELFIPETQSTIKAHPSFRVFATQNPAGTYGGRKVLSRAFRNRFVELHFDELPNPELEVIIQKKCAIPKAMSKKMVKVMSELQLVRKATEAFQGKKGFITLRDLFRWGFRYSKYDPSTQFHDWDLHVAEEGYLVLGSRLRVPEDAHVVAKVLEKVFKKKIDIQDMFSLEPKHSLVLRDEMKILNRLGSSTSIVWTRNATRMASLLLHSAKFEEPVLLVGQTGCGKTSVCQIVCDILEQRMHTINCHLNTDASDFLGSLRPCRDHSQGRLFEWKDGPLIETMLKGDIILVDEISLADDSVIERLNPVLEQERTINLSERLSDESALSADTRIVAQEKFRLFATMNPGGDYGKKELSPALRNRFFEIWCPSQQEVEDIGKILRGKLAQIRFQDDHVQTILDFLQWYERKINRDNCFSIRDIDTWSAFIRATSSSLGLEWAILQGACLVFLDGLPTSESALSSEDIRSIREEALMLLKSKLDRVVSSSTQMDLNFESVAEFLDSEQSVAFGMFSLAKLPSASSQPLAGKGAQDFRASTGMLRNAFKIARGLQVDRPVLLEGPPGAGKSTMVKVLARVTGNKLVRINLSDQTDIADLFGTDLPAENEAVGTFTWHNGAFLSALQAGHWILLDELNLATQSVLEGLNACLDHRGEVFIPELNKTFVINRESTKIFATQNPSKDGSGRKGLPKSFLNRFTKVYIEDFSAQDIVGICCQGSLQAIPNGQSIAETMTRTVLAFHEEVNVKRTFGIAGSPWTFNIRDVIRWAEAIETGDLSEIVESGVLLLTSRFRTQEDRELARHFFVRTWQASSTAVVHLRDAFTPISMTSSTVTIGRLSMARAQATHALESSSDLFLLRDQYPLLESLMMCVREKWIPILCGQAGTGKTSLVEVLAQILNQPLCSITMNATTDTTELLGTFEQTDEYSGLKVILEEVERLLQSLEDNPRISRSELAFLAKIREGLKLQKDQKHFVEQIQDVIDSVESLGHEVAQIRPVALELSERLRLVVTQHKEVLNATFAWVDSVLVKAVEQGHWLLIDNANFCDSSVLDRLNGLLEPDGVLAIGEQGCRDGEVRTVVPHTNFRVFLTMDPKNGELSHAMRNRGVEIFVHHTMDGHDLLMSNLRTRLSTKKADHVYAKFFQNVSMDLAQASRISQHIGMELAVSTRIDSLCQRMVEGHEFATSDPVMSTGSPALTLMGRHPNEYEAWVKCSLAHKLAQSHPTFPLESMLALILNTEHVKKEVFQSFASLLSIPKKLTELRDVGQRFILVLNPMNVAVKTRNFDIAQALAKLDQVFARNWSHLSTEIQAWDPQVIYSMWKISIVLQSLRQVFAGETLEEVWEDFALHWIVWRDHLKSVWSSYPAFAKLLDDVDTMVDLAIIGTLKLWGCIHKSLPMTQTFHDDVQAHEFKKAVAISGDWSVYKCQDARELQILVELMGKVVYENLPLPQRANVVVKSERDQTIRWLIVALFKAHVQHKTNYLRHLRSGSSPTAIPTYPLVQVQSGAQSEFQTRGDLLFYSVAERKISTLFGLDAKGTSSEFCMKLLTLPGTIFSLSPICAQDELKASMRALYENMANARGCLEGFDEDLLEVKAKKLKEDVTRIAGLLAHLSETESRSFAELVKICADNKKIPRNVELMLQDLDQAAQLEPSSIKDLFQLQVLVGLVFFHLACLLVKVDMKSLLETKVNILTSEAGRARVMILTDSSMKTLHLTSTIENYDSSSYLIDQSHKDVQACAHVIPTIQDQIPVRLESAKGLSSDLGRIGHGSLSRKHVHDLVEAILTGTSVDLDAKLNSWRETLCHFKADLEVKYPTFCDVWSLANLGLAEVMDGIFALKEELRLYSAPDDQMDPYHHMRALYHGEMSVFAPAIRCNRVLEPERLPAHVNIVELFRCEKHTDTLSNSLRCLADDQPPITCLTLEYYLTRATEAETGLIIPSNQVQFLCHYKKTMLEPETFSEDDPALGLEVHKMALACTLAELEAKSSEFTQLLPLSAACVEIMTYVNQSLLVKWPDNVLLADIVKAAEGILAHQIGDSQKEYKSALEVLIARVKTWNKNAFASIMIEDEKLLAVMEHWRLHDVKSTRTLPSELIQGLHREAITLGAMVLRTILNKLASRRSRKMTKPKLPSRIAHLLMVFMLQSNLNDFSLRLRILKSMERLFQSGLSNRPTLFCIFRHVHEYFLQFEEGVKKAQETNLSLAKRKIADVLKGFTNKRHKDWEQFARQKKKVNDECLKILQAALPLIPSIEPAKDVAPLQSVQEYTYVEPETNQMLFKDTNGEVIGHTKDLLGKVIKTEEGIKLALAGLTSKTAVSLREDIDALEPFLAQLSDAKFKSTTDKHKAQKMIENILKELRDDGLSFRMGEFHALSVGKILAKGKVNLQAQASSVMRCLAKFEGFQRDLALQSQPHVNQMVRQRSKGMVAHGLRQLVEASHNISSVQDALTSIEASMEELNNFQSVRTQEAGREQMRLLAEEIRNLSHSLLDPYLDLGLDPAGLRLSTTVARLHQFGVELRALSKTLANQGENHKAVDQITAILNSLQGTLEADSRHAHSRVKAQMTSIQSQVRRLNSSVAGSKPLTPLSTQALENFQEYLLGFTRKCLNVVQTVKKTCPTLAQNGSPFLDLKTLLTLVDSLQIEPKSDDLKGLLQFRSHWHNVRNDCSGLDTLWREASCLIKPCFQVVARLLSVSDLFVNVTACHLWKITDVFHKFVLHEFPKKDDEKNDAKESGQTEKAEGCGLGDGEGDKATTDDVDDEDLFDNPQDPKEEGSKDQEDEKKEDKGEEEHIDYSDKLDDGETKDLDKGDDGSDEEGEEKEDPPSDVEETNVDDEDRLQPEDWGSDAEEDEDKEKEEKKKEGQEDKAQEEKDPHRQKDASAVQEKEEDEAKSEDADPEETNVEKEENPRQREPDQNEDENGDVDMKDDEYHNLPEDIEPEDLDLEDDANMDANEEGEMDPMEQEEDEIRQPDFEDEQTDKNDQDDEKDHEESNPLGDAEPEESSQTQTQHESKNAQTSEDHMDGQDEEERPDEKDQGPDAMEQKSRNKGKSNPEDDQMKEEDKAEGAVDDPDTEAMDVTEDEARLELDTAEMCLEVQEKLEIERSKHVLDDEKSQTFAHMNPEEQAAESAASTIDEVAFEKLKDLKLKVEKQPQPPKPDHASQRDANEALKQELPKTLSEEESQALEAQRIQTMTVSRGDMSHFGQSEALEAEPTDLNSFKDLTPESGKDVQVSSEHLRKWSEICNCTAELSRTLTEQLRLIIEPTKATRLRGDYKSGKRINIRKVIPYIASHFRKDKIWMRRTKPSKRDCEIMLALDDSSSMSDNQVQLLAFQALSTLCQALSVLEIGKMGVLRFGEKVSVALPPKANFSAQDGAQCVSQFSFDQNVTKIVDLLRVCSTLYSLPTDRPLSKLLIVISDGKGILNEGRLKVEEAVRTMKLQNIFTIFLVVETSASSESVLDIRTPVFDDQGQLRSIDSYMTTFPFPYYIILREVKNLPVVLGDALRQWIELISSN